ncbi:MAG: hypothetical protein IKE45_11455 [Halomonas sp.]|nr:hypothetical protein [Halomonas sp.]MBR2514606.1 hypothetical protein [Halomonas sp.]
MAILNCGFANWQQQGSDITGSDAAPFDLTNFEVSLREKLVANAEEVKAAGIKYGRFCMPAMGVNGVLY